MTYWGFLTLNSLEYAASIITIQQLCLQHLHDSIEFPCILSILDSTSAIDDSTSLPSMNPPIAPKPIWLIT